MRAQRCARRAELMLHLICKWNGFPQALQYVQAFNLLQGNLDA
jgi:hypothetical protein